MNKFIFKKAPFFLFLPWFLLFATVLLPNPLQYPCMYSSMKLRWIFDPVYVKWHLLDSEEACITYFVPICKHLSNYSCRLMILNPSTHTAEPLKNIPTVSRNIALCKGIVLMCNFIVLDKFMDLESRKIQVRMIVLSLPARKSLVLIKISEVQFSHEWKE